MEEEKAEGTFGEYKKLPTQEQIDPKQFQKDTNKNPYMKQNNLKIVNKNYFDLIKLGLIILGVFFFGVLYLIYSGYTTNDIVIPSCPPAPEPITIPACPTFNCPNISMPDCIVDCGNTYLSPVINVTLNQSS